MSSWKYLEAYASSIPAAQRQSLLNLIFSDVISNKIKTTSEYESVLAKDLASLTSGLTIPLFALRTASFQSVTNSANFNDMESKAITALGVLYGEASNLEQAIDHYGKVIIGNLDSLSSMVARLEKQTDTMEILASNTEGYTLTTFDSFNENNTYRLNRSAVVATTPFIIPDIGFIIPEEDAVIVANSLTLPTDIVTSYRITSAYITNQIPPSGVVVTSQDIPSVIDPLELANLIDSNPSTYWAETIDLQTLSSTSAEADLVMNLAGVQLVSNIDLVPFTRFPYEITSVEYTKNIDSGTYYEMLDDTTQYPLIADRTLNVKFSDKYADSIKLHIKQSNYSSLRYVSNNADNTITALFDTAVNRQIPTTDLLDPNSYYFAMTSLMKDLLDIEKSKLTDTDTIDVFEFMYGAKTIDIGRTGYLNQGIYVAQPYHLLNGGAVGLNTVEGPNHELTSVEYSLIVEYLDIPAGNTTPEFAGRFTYDILPANTKTVINEVLDGVDDTNTSSWNATSHFGVRDLTTVVVKQNNIPLIPSAYSISQDPITKKVTVNLLDSVITPTQRRISFYTISYLPSLSAYTVDLVQHDESFIYLRILLRSNSANTAITPTVHSYSLKFKTFQ